MANQIYEDFDLLFQRSDNGYRVQVVNSPDGTAHGLFVMPFSHLELENFVLKFGQTWRTMRDIYFVRDATNRSLQDFGGRLFDAVFSGPVAERLRSSLAIVNQKENTGLRIRLRLSDTLRIFVYLENDLL